MTAEAVLSIVLQLLALFPSLEPAIIRAVEDFKKLFENGGQPSQADIDALLDRVKTQSATIQSQPD